ncbi:MAG: hypothetical protein IKC26_09990 [Clostridia bacterium]|nr:hypothetical protein [Clostridia bacterium]MBR2908352.1 hypothetical protein [Clostridia bacterium]
MARRNEITNAMKKLGVKSRNVQIVEGGLFTPVAQIFADGEYFGIYDFERHTFVD